MDVDRPLGQDGAITETTMQLLMQILAKKLTCPCCEIENVVHIQGEEASEMLKAESPGWRSWQLASELTSQMHSGRHGGNANKLNVTQAPVELRHLVQAIHWRVGSLGPTVLQESLILHPKEL